MATVLDGGRTVANDLSIAAITPAMNALAYGSTIQLTGSHLDLLPVLVPIGPNLLATVVAADGTSATLELPAAASAWHR
eukprot:CAMPEP_0174870532 /NCGR_PEP_ID=MMETSP1114-20130205/69849_1 /TAXON_ID=312471 /ORGANISM="Neobodo designis, Strain CCAP 1951/1" /LENGTH=78 /DNA_ID=CAMNT_0016105799 /DNA_START=45 /DNA_END=277 /DNA_ORIENTATION=-